MMYHILSRSEIIWLHFISWRLFGCHLSICSFRGFLSLTHREMLWMDRRLIQNDFALHIIPSSHIMISGIVFCLLNCFGCPSRRHSVSKIQLWQSCACDLCQTKLGRVTVLCQSFVQILELFKFSFR